MKKRIIPFILICALLLAVAVSCNNNPGGGGSEPKRPATLTLGSFRDYYAKGVDKSALVGTLYYTDTDGKITTLSLTSEGVTTDFDSSAVVQGKTLKITYKNIDCVATYNIVELEPVDISGTFVFDKNTTYSFVSGSNTIKKRVYDSWYKFFIDEEVDPTDLTYSTAISSSGKTVIKVAGDSWSYYPDGQGGILYKPSEWDYFDFESKYIPDNHFYVSTAPEDSRSITNETARGNYLIIAFNYNDSCNMYMWFKKNLNDLDKLDPTKADVVVPADKFSFGTAGVELEKQDIGAYDCAKNLNIILNKDGYYSTDKAFSIISHAGDEYKGYSYCMKLTDTYPTWNEPT